MFALLGFLISSCGSILGIAGALMMARSYHAFSFLGFIKYSFLVTLKLFSGRREEVVESNEIAAYLGTINEAKRGYSLMGLYLVFLGFCMQLAGSTVSFISGHFCSVALTVPP